MIINLINSNVYCPKCHNVINIDSLHACFNHKWGLLCDNCEYCSFFVLDVNISENLNYSQFKKLANNGTEFDLVFITRMVGGIILEEYLIKNNIINISEENITEENITELSDFVVGNYDRILLNNILDNCGVEVNGYNVVDVLNKNPDYDTNCDGQYILLEVISKNNTKDYIFYIGD